MSRHDASEDVTDILLENKLLFEQLSELKGCERKYLNERNACTSLLSDQYEHLKDDPYHDIILHLITQVNDKSTNYDKAIARAIEKEGEVITLKAKINSVQQHARIEHCKLEEELQQFKDNARNEKDRQNLSTNEHISLLMQERDASLANEQILAERVGELMDEIVKLNDEVAKVKQQKLDISLNKDCQNEENLHLQRELHRVSEEDEVIINSLQLQLAKMQARCDELEQEVGYQQKRCETQRQELQVAGDSTGTQQIELFQYKAKVKDLKDQMTMLNRQLETLTTANKTLTSDNHLLAEKFVNLSEELTKREESIRNIQRDYKYKLKEVEKNLQLEKEKHNTVEAQYEEKKDSMVTLQKEINSLRVLNNKVVRAKTDLVTDNETLQHEIEQLRLDKQELLKQITSEDETLQTLLRKQDEQYQIREMEQNKKLLFIAEKLSVTQEIIDEKDGQINLLNHHNNDQQKMITQLEEHLKSSQSDYVETKQILIDREKQIEILQQNIAELKAQLEETNVQLETCEDELSQCKEDISKIEVFNGKDTHVLYSNVSLQDNIEKLRDLVLDSNQLIGSQKRKVGAVNVELRGLSEQNQQLKERLQVVDNENSSLQSQLTSTSAHLESSHKEIRQLRESILKGEKGKRIMERRVHSIESALSEMQHFMQAAKVQNVDSNQTKEIYEHLKGAVQEILDNPNPTTQAVEVELVIEELGALRDEIQHIQSQHETVVGERDSISKKLVHEQNWVDKLRSKEEELTRTLDEKNEQLSSVKHELQLKEKLVSDKERAFQLKKGSLEDEIKTLKMRYKSMTSGEQCGHQSLLEDLDSLKNQLEVARNTVQYKEQQLGRMESERDEMEKRLKNSNTEKLHDQILQLNIVNSRLEGQLSGVTGDNEQHVLVEERNNLLNVISQNKTEIEELNRKLFQAELRSETLVNAIEENKCQYDLERERFKRDLTEFHERVTTQKEQLNQCLKELDTYQKRYYETKKLKEAAEEEVIRLRERVQQLRDCGNVESDRLSRLEKDIDRKKESISVLEEKCSTFEAKVHEQEIQISQLQRTNMSLEQIKTTLQLRLADALQKYESEKTKFENTTQKLKSKAKDYKKFYEKENSALLNKSNLLEEETTLLKLHVNKEESWRKTTEKTYQEWLSKNSELETMNATLEEELRIQRSTIHALNCTLSARQEEIKALNIELKNGTEIRYHYERMYRDMETRSRMSQAASPRGADITHPIPHGTIISSSPIREEKSGEGVISDSELSRLTLEEEGLVLDDPELSSHFQDDEITHLQPIDQYNTRSEEEIKDYIRLSPHLEGAGVSPKSE